MCTETDEKPTVVADSSSGGVSAVVNPEYLVRDAQVEPCRTAGALAGPITGVPTGAPADDEGSYLTCAGAPAPRHYYDFTDGQQLIAA